MTQPEIYLFSNAEKDSYCLAPAEEALRAHFSTVSNIYANDLNDTIDRFSTDLCPVAVFTSIDAFDLARFIRGGRPFVAIGLEHGVAPFKSYTYNNRFIEYDCYISPTRMWADRLARLHPRYAAKFTHVAYPRMDDLKARAEAFTNLDDPAWAGAAPEARDLVVMSWGVDMAALSQLPDREGIVYLMHPSMFRVIDKAGLKKARVVLSDPAIASKLIAGAARVFGDHSSMTLEAARLHPRTYMFVERGLYNSSCDLKPEYFDPQSEGFGQVDHVDFRLPAEHVLDMTGLAAALSGDTLAHVATVSSWAPQEMLPDMDGANGVKAAAAIAEAVNRIWPEMRLLDLASPNLLALKTVYGAYKDVLGRKPDFPAALDHARAWLNNPAPAQAKTLHLYNNFAHSPEGTKRWLAGNFAMPEVAISPIGRSA